MKIEVGKNYKHLVSTLIRMTPTLRYGRIEKVRHQAIRALRDTALVFKKPCALKFSDAFQFVSGETAQEIIYGGTI